MRSVIDRFEDGDYDQAVNNGIAPYSLALLSRTVETAHPFGFDEVNAARLRRSRRRTALAPGLLVSQVGLHILGPDFRFTGESVGELTVMAIPPGIGTGPEDLPAEVLEGTGYPLSAVPNVRTIAGRPILAEALFGILAVPHGDRPPVLHAMRLEQLVVHRDTGRVALAAMIGQTEADFADNMRGEGTAGPAAVYTIPNQADTGNDRETVYYNGTGFVQVVARLAIAEGSDPSILGVFDRLNAVMPAELSA